MRQVELEICVDGARAAGARAAVSAAHAGGAARVELCRALEVAGLTPHEPALRAARQAFGDRPGMLVLVRPRPGSFCATAREIATMLRQIERAAAAGADGVVLGVLREADGQVDTLALARLVRASRDAGLRTTFHRAFDAAPDPLEALERVVSCGVDRVLTSGSAWGGAGGAWEGRAALARLVAAARGRVEIVVGGGVTAGNVGAILRALPLDHGPVSVHAYSGAQTHGETTPESVARLLQAVRAAIT